MAVELRVYACESCSAPLPRAADGQHVTCTFCHHVNLVDGNEALVREEKSRAEAELLFATLGNPPSLSQRFALAVTSGIAWVFMPFILVAFLRVVSYPMGWIEAIYEHASHERLLHVLRPWQAWLFELGLPAVLLVAVLIWSLFGERLDARRELQAALASKPPKTPGGPSICRRCDAELVVPVGALGVRCAFCGSDNLVRLPATFLEKAKVRDTSLRADMKTARAKAAEGRHRVRRAIRWRAPLVLALLWLASPSSTRMHIASFGDYALQPENLGVYRLVIRKEHEWPGRELKTFAECGDTRVRRSLGKEHLIVGSTRCDEEACNAIGLFALEHGQTLRLEGNGSAIVTIGDRTYDGGLGVLYDGFGELVGRGTLPFEAKAPLSGFYKVDVRGERGADVEACVAR